MERGTGEPTEPRPGAGILDAHGRPILRDVDSAYRINRAAYQLHAENVYLKHFNPRTLLQFPIMLPFQMPIPDGSTVTFSDRHKASTFVFSQIEVQVPIHLGLATEEVPLVPLARTAVELVLVTAESFESVDDLVLTPVFDDLLLHLNLVVDAYRLLYHDFDAFRVALEALSPVTLVRMVRLPDWQNAEVHPWILNGSLPADKSYLDPEQVAEIYQFASVIKSDRNPFFVAADVLNHAGREFRLGQYRTAVVFSQTAMELFLGTLFVEMRILEGATQDAAAEEREATPFIKLVKKEFSGRLGGKWDLSNESSPLHSWYEKLYQLRNHVAHAGYRPTFTETLEALEAARSARAYVVGLVAAARSPYSKLAQFIQRSPSSEEGGPMNG